MNLIPKEDKKATLSYPCGNIFEVLQENIHEEDIGLELNLGNGVHCMTVGTGQGTFSFNCIFPTLSRIGVVMGMAVSRCGPILKVLPTPMHCACTCD